MTYPRGFGRRDNSAKGPLSLCRNGFSVLVIANLNLIERLWRFVRKQSLNSTWFDSFDQFQTAIDDCLNNMATDHKQEAATLFTHKFQRFEDVSILAA